jgi:hypothetical protein
VTRKTVLTSTRSKRLGRHSRLESEGASRDSENRCISRRSPGRADVALARWQAGILRVPTSRQLAIFVCDISSAVEFIVFLVAGVSSLLLRLFLFFCVHANVCGCSYSWLHNVLQGGYDVTREDEKALPSVSDVKRSFSPP